MELQTSRSWGNFALEPTRWQKEIEAWFSDLRCHDTGALLYLAALLSCFYFLLQVE